MELKINQTAPVVVRAKFPDGLIDPLYVQSGQNYSIKVHKNQYWKDFWVIKCSANGFYYPFFRKSLRVPNCNFFLLCGVIEGETKHYFKIGKDLADFVVPVSGKLQLFANDVPGYYGNNKGQISLDIERLESS